MDLPKWKALMSGKSRDRMHSPASRVLHITRTSFGIYSPLFHVLTCLLTCIPTYLLTYRLTYRLTYLLTYLLTSLLFNCMACVVTNYQTNSFHINIRWHQLSFPNQLSPYLVFESFEAFSGILVFTPRYDKFWYRTSSHPIHLWHPYGAPVFLFNPGSGSQSDWYQ